MPTSLKTRRARAPRPAGRTTADPSADLRGLEAPLPQPPPGLMTCTLVAEPFDDPNWLFEPKLDGLRVWCRRDAKGNVTLLSRNDKPQNLQFPDVVAAVGDALDRPAVLDGEIVCLDEHGRSSFRALQQRFHLEDAEEIARRAAEHPAYFFVFDLMYLDRYDVTSLPLSRRKELLRGAVKWSDRIRWTEGTAGKGVGLLGEACRVGGEGIVGKDLRSTYFAGRSHEWVKIKCVGRQEFVIGGWTDPQRSRVGLGALLVGYYSDDGKQFVYAGKVGTGYTKETLLDLRERLGTLGQEQKPFDAGDPPLGEHVHWVKPALVAEIGYAEWTQHGLLRQPRFEGLRMDKNARQVRRERPKHAEAAREQAERELAAHSPVRQSPAPKAKAKTNAKGKTSGKASTRPAAKGADRAAPAAAEASLAEYRRKRDFKETPEPEPKVARSKDGPVFVVQEHHASKLHWDFRLEADGVLKSWAVTREPSLDPAVKRLAVQTEDHPLAYADFSGDIPEGHYGAGHVGIWDKGTYTPAPDFAQGLAAGKAEFELHGEKLKGTFVLIRMRGRGNDAGDNWLLIKKRDRFARPGAGDGARDGKAAPAAKKSGTRARTGTAGTTASAVASAGAKAKPVSQGKPEMVEVSNPDKVYFPNIGATKGDAVRFYLDIADTLLPHLRDRPVTLERLPEGVTEGGPRFWQKNTPAYYPKWIPRIELPSERGKSVQYALINNEETLAYLVNQGALTFHTYLSRVGSLERPDYVLFDLDPGEATFADAVKIAKSLHRMLDAEKVDSFPKTSGKTGLHILVPWRQPGGDDEARAWAMRIAEQLVTELPDVATVERMKDQRGGRVYVDVIQNALGHHVVPPYVLRATPGATVSTPLEWDELTAKLDPKKFNLKTLPPRLKKKGDLMAPLLAGNG